MSFGQELNDFVKGFTSGYDWMEKREERKLDRAERAEDRQYRRDRDATMDARDQRNFDYGVGRDQANDAWRESGRAFDWEQIDRTNQRNDRLDQRAVENDAWTRDNANRTADRADRALDITERSGLDERELKLLELEQGTGGATAPRPEDLSVPGFEPTSANGMGEDGSFLQSAAWTPGGGTNFRPSTGQRTRRGTLGMRGDEIAQALVVDLGRDLGLPQAAAIGLVGQLAGETGGFQHYQELKPVVPGSRGGAGYSQWTGPRRRQFEAFAERHGLDPRSYEANYGFLRHELTRTSEGRILDRIRDVNDPVQAGRLFTGSEASRSGFLRPRIVNTAGRDRWTNRVAGLFGGGQRQVRAARGGMIEEQDALPFEADDPLGDEYGPEEASVPTPTPAPRGAIPDPEYDGDEASADGEPGTKPGVQAAVNAGREAVREGLTAIVQENGFDQRRAVLDERTQQVRSDILKGYGAAPAGMMRRIADMIDPEKRMNPAQRNLAAMGNVYNYYMERGEMDKAKEAAKSMSQFHQQAFNQFTALAQAAVEEGRMDDATRAAMAAYTNIPDGRDMKIEERNGKYVISFTDIDSGEEIEREVMDPTQMAEQIMKFNPGTFTDSILRAAGEASPEFKSMDATQREEYDMAVRGYVQDRLGENSQFSPEQIDILGDIATNIGAFEENRLNGSQAARLAISLAGAEATKDEEGNWIIKEGDEVISSKVPNSDMYRVKIGNRTVVLDPGTLQDLQGVKSARQSEAVADATSGQAKDERWDASMSSAADSFSSMLGHIGNAFGGGQGVEEGVAIPTGEADERQRFLDANPDLAGPAARRAATPSGEVVEPNPEVERLEQQRQLILSDPGADSPAMQQELARIDAEIERLTGGGGAIPE